MGGQVRARRELELDTDSVTFWQEVIGLLASALLAAREIYSVVKLQATPHRGSWQTYLGLAFALWLFIDIKGDPKVVRSVRFGLGLLLLAMGIPAVVFLMDLSSETARALSLWSHATLAILYSGIFLFCVVWFRDKFRNAKLNCDSGAEAVKKV